MIRNERKTLQDLLRATHAQREEHTLSPTWRHSVMVEIGRTRSLDDSPSPFERLAPRFTLAAAALSVLVLATATWSLRSLPGELDFAYTSQLLSIVPTTLTGL